MNDLKFSCLEGLSQEVGVQVKDFSSAFNKYIRCLVCLASVRTNRRIGDQSPHFRELSSDILIRIAQTLGWFIDLKGTVRVLETNND